MLINPAIDVALICPVCQKPLDYRTTSLHCTGCHSNYTIQDGVPALLRNDMSDFRRQELDYWNQRFLREREKQEPAFFYAEDRTRNNSWGLYRFSRYVDALPRSAYILEIGSGSIPVSFYYQKFYSFPYVVTTDISVEAMISIKQYAETQKLETQNRYFAVEMGSLPFADQSFDVVVIHSALHHAEESEAAFAQMARVLKPGGLLIVGHEPNTLNLSIIRFITKRLKVSEARTQVSYSVADEEDQSFTRGQLQELCQRYHIEVVELRPVWLFAGLLFGMPHFMERVLKRQWKLPSVYMRRATRIDELIARLPLIKHLFFHWSLVGRKAFPGAPPDRNAG